MRLLGIIKNVELVILVDTGSTYNFVDPYIVQRIGVEMNKSARVQVKVTNGDSMLVEGSCKQVPFHIHGTSFVANFFALPLLVVI